MQVGLSSTYEMSLPPRTQALVSLQLPPRMGAPWQLQPEPALSPCSPSTPLGGSSITWQVLRVGSGAAVTCLFAISPGHNH